VVEFSALIRDSGLMSMAEAKKVFALVQHASDSGHASSGGHGGHAAAAASHAGGAHAPLPPPPPPVYDDDDLMTFAEFLSGVAKIGMWKYHAAGGSLAVKINKAVETVCALWTDADEEEAGGQDGGGVAASVSDITQSRIF
jgi:hypothetical protein